MNEHIGTGMKNYILRRIQALNHIYALASWGFLKPLQISSVNENSFLCRKQNLNSNCIKIPRLIFLPKSPHRNN